MSVSRSIRRRFDRSRPEDQRRWPKDPAARRSSIHETNADGSIRTLRPTKGWLRTSGQRVALRITQARHMALLQMGLVT